MSDQIAGIILTGGKSSRMGSDKAVLPFRGGTFASVLAGEMRRVIPRIFLSGSLIPGLKNFSFIPDIFPDEGPVGAILSVMRQVKSDWYLFCPCDLPLINHHLIIWLTENVAAGPGAFAVQSGEIHQPLLLLIHQSKLPELTAWFETGGRRAMHMISALSGKWLDLPEEFPSSILQNINSPEDLALLS